MKRCGCCCLRWLAVAETAAGPGGAASPMLLLCFFSLFPLIFFCFALSSSSFLLLLSVFLLFFSLFLCFLLLLLLFLSCSVFFPLSLLLYFYSLSPSSSIVFHPRVSSFSPVFIGEKGDLHPCPVNGAGV